MPTGVHAAAAVELVTAPQVSNLGNAFFNVHWGPIVCLDSGASGGWLWGVNDPLDAYQYPRKFSVGPIFGNGTINQYPRTNPGVLADHREYWSESPIQVPPLIDETNYYIPTAQAETAIQPPTIVSTNPLDPLNGQHVPTFGCTNGPSCGYFKVPNPSYESAEFTSPYAVSGNPKSDTTVIYVDGNAGFDDNAVFDGVTVIVTGQLNITENNGSGNAMDLKVPWNAHSEYPDYSTNPPPNPVPCNANAIPTTTCNTASDAGFRGHEF